MLIAERWGFRLSADIVPLWPSHAIQLAMSMGLTASGLRRIEPQTL
jgi:hypothetical protein